MTSNNDHPENFFCTKVGPGCPVSESIYTYRPNLGANVFFLIVFALCAIAQLILGVKYKTWTFAIALVLGCTCEAIGYIGRILLWNNVFDITGFTTQIVCLLIAPAFMAAGIYLTLKHFVLAFGRRYSVIPPSLYTWIFISGDILSLVLQGVGGGIVAGAISPSAISTGDNLAVAGVVLQVAALAFFGVMASVYILRTWRHRHELSPKAIETVRSAKFRAFAFGTGLAYLIILIRCCYRIPELVGGWRKSVFLSEIDFVVLDGTMIAIAALTLTIVHPGIFFPLLSAPVRRRMLAETSGPKPPPIRTTATWKELVRNARTALTRLVVLEIW